MELFRLKEQKESIFQFKKRKLKKEELKILWDMQSDSQKLGKDHFLVVSNMEIEKDIRNPSSSCFFLGDFGDTILVA